MPASSFIFSSKMLRVWIRLVCESYKAVAAILIAGSLTLPACIQLLSDVFVVERWMSPEAQILAPMAPDPSGPH